MAMKDVDIIDTRFADKPNAPVRLGRVNTDHVIAAHAVEPVGDSPRMLVFCGTVAGSWQFLCAGQPSDLD